MRQVDEKAYDDLVASCEELREVCAALFRIINQHPDAKGMVEKLETQLMALGIEHGFGVRAGNAIAKA